MAQRELIYIVTYACIAAWYQLVPEPASAQQQLTGWVQAWATKPTPAAAATAALTSWLLVAILHPWYQAPLRHTSSRGGAPRQSPAAAAAAAAAGAVTRKHLVLALARLVHQALLLAAQLQLPWAVGSPALFLLLSKGRQGYYALCSCEAVMLQVPLPLQAAVSGVGVALVTAACLHSPPDSLLGGVSPRLFAADVLGCVVLPCLLATRTSSSRECRALNWLWWLGRPSRSSTRQPGQPGPPTNSSSSGSSKLDKQASKQGKAPDGCSSGYGGGAAGGSSGGGACVPGFYPYRSRMTQAIVGVKVRYASGTDHARAAQVVQAAVQQALTSQQRQQLQTRQRRQQQHEAQQAQEQQQQQQVAQPQEQQERPHDRNQLQQQQQDGSQQPASVQPPNLRVQRGVVVPGCALYLGNLVEQGDGDHAATSCEATSGARLGDAPVRDPHHRLQHQQRPLGMCWFEQPQASQLLAELVQRRLDSQGSGSGRQEAWGVAATVTSNQRSYILLDIGSCVNNSNSSSSSSSHRLGHVVVDLPFTPAYSNQGSCQGASSASSLVQGHDGLGAGVEQKAAPSRLTLKGQQQQQNQQQQDDVLPYRDVHRSADEEQQQGRVLQQQEDGAVSVRAVVCHGSTVLVDTHLYPGPPASEVSPVATYRSGAGEPLHLTSVQLQLWLPDSLLQAVLSSSRQRAVALAVFLCHSEPAVGAGQGQEAAGGSGPVPAILEVEQVLLLFLPTGAHQELSAWAPGYQLSMPQSTGLLSDIGVLLDTLQLVHAAGASGAGTCSSRRVGQTHGSGTTGQLLHAQLQGMVHDAVAAAEGLQRYLHHTQLAATSQLVAQCQQELLQALR